MLSGCLSPTQFSDWTKTEFSNFQPVLLNNSYALKQLYLFTGDKDDHSGGFWGPAEVEKRKNQLEIEIRLHHVHTPHPTNATVPQEGLSRSQIPLFLFKH